MFKTLGRDNRLVMLALLVWALGEGLWINLRQLYLAQLGATPDQIGTALALESIARAALLIPAGYLIDLIGARQMLIAAWVLGIAGPLVGSMANTWQGFVPGLLVYASSAFAVPSISAYVLYSVSDHIDDTSSQRVLAVVYAAYPVGLIISPLLGGIIADRFGIRTCLLLAVCIYSVSTFVTLFTRHAPPHPRPADHRTAELFRDRAFLGRLLYYLLAYVTACVGFVLIPNFLQETRGFSFAIIGLLFSILAIGTAAANLLVGRLSARWGLAGVYMLVWAAMLGVWQVSALFGIGLAFLALGSIYAIRMVATAGVARVVKPQDRGMAFSMLETALSLALSVASRLAGGLFDLTPAHDLPLVAALLGIPVVLIVWFAARVWRSPQSGEAEPAVVPAPGD